MFEGMSAVQVSKLPGVSDLSIKVRVKFAKALLAEDQGDHDKAAEYLDQAVALEQAGG